MPWRSIREWGPVPPDFYTLCINCRNAYTGVYRRPTIGYRSVRELNMFTSYILCAVFIIRCVFLFYAPSLFFIRPLIPTFRTLRSRIITNLVVVCKYFGWNSTRSRALLFLFIVSMIVVIFVYSWQTYDVIIWDRRSVVRGFWIQKISWNILEWDVKR